MMQKESHAFMYVVTSYKGFRGIKVTFSGVLGLRKGGKGVWNWVAYEYYTSFDA